MQCPDLIRPFTHALGGEKPIEDTGLNPLAESLAILAISTSTLLYSRLSQPSEWRVLYGILTRGIVRLYDKVQISEFMPEVPSPYGFLIGFPNNFDWEEGGEEVEVAGLGLVQAS